MITFLLSNWKSIAATLLLVVASTVSYFKGYEARDIIAMKEQIEFQKQVIEAKKIEIVQTEKVVTQYVNKIITVEKEVPYFIYQSNTGITDEENKNCVLPDSFMKLYRESLGAK